MNSDQPTTPPAEPAAKRGKRRSKPDPLAGMTREMVVEGYVAASGAKRRPFLRALQTDDAREVAAAIERQLRACLSMSRYQTLAKLALKLDTPAIHEVLASQAQTQTRYAGTAVRVLGRSNHPQRDDLLVQILAGSRTRAARSAGQAILERPAPAVVLPLCRIALGQDRPYARHQANRLLAQLGGHAALARLLLSQTGRPATAILIDIEIMLQIKVGRSLFGFNLGRFLEREAADTRSPVRAQAAAVQRAIADRATLLRPASSAADTLLRPVESAAFTPDNTLLRPATPEGALDD